MPIKTTPPSIIDQATPVTSAAGMMTPVRSMTTPMMIALSSVPSP